MDSDAAAQVAEAWFNALPPLDASGCAGAGTTCSLVHWDDVHVLDVDARPEDEPLAHSLARVPYVLVVRAGRAVGLARGSDAALCAPSTLHVFAARHDPQGPHPLIGLDGIDASTANEYADLRASPSAFFVIGSSEGVRSRLRASIEPSFDGCAASPLAAYLDMLLELYELVYYERVRVDSREYVRRCAAAHARHFDLESVRGRERDAAGLAALAYVLYTQPQLEPLVHATYGRLLMFRLRYLFAGEALVARACALQRGADAMRGIYTQVPVPVPAPVPASASLATEPPPLDDASVTLLLRRLGAPHGDAVLRRHCALSWRSALRRAAGAVLAPRNLYLVSVRRDAFDLWAGADADADADAAVPHAFFGMTFVHARELAPCLARRAQHQLFAAARALRRGAYVAPMHESPCALELRTMTRQDLAQRIYERAEARRARGATAPAISRQASTVASTASTALSCTTSHACTQLHEDAQELVAGAKDSFLRRVLAPYGVASQMPRFVYEAELEPSAHACTERLHEVQRRIAHERSSLGPARRHALFPPDGVELDAERFVRHVWAAWPPCHARVVSGAIMSDLAPRAHPRHLERIRIALFMFYAGFSFGRALDAWRHLFMSKCAYARQGAHAFARHSEYARTLEGLYALYRSDVDASYHGASSGRASAGADLEGVAPAQPAPAGAARPPGHGPASCRTLCESRACPMAAYDEAVGAGSPLAAALRSEFAYVPDIEDVPAWHAPLDAAPAVAPVARAQARCARFYKAAHRGWEGDDGAIAHPLAFYQRSLAYAEALVPPVPPSTTGTADGAVATDGAE